MNCLLVVNTLSGNASKVREAELIEKYAARDVVSVKYIRDASDSYSLDGIDKLILCGGDGTLHKALNLSKGRAIDIYYLPFGTFNETAKGKKGSGSFSLSKLGRVGDVDFSYVAAAGSFTEIGQSPSAKAKRRFKIFAYFSKVLSAYRVHRIRATIYGEGIHETGVFTLIMISDARRCFGFRFNRLAQEDSDEVQLLLIKAPKRNGIVGKIRMFFPFFRAFFIGFSKEYRSKNILFTSLKKAVIRLEGPCAFCIDGEPHLLAGELSVAKHRQKANVFIIRD